MVKIKDKKLKKLQDHHEYRTRKVDELTKDRKKDRSSESKEILMRLKKTKLAIKDAISKAKQNLGLTKKDVQDQCSNCLYMSNRAALVAPSPSPPPRGGGANAENRPGLVGL